MKEKDNMPRLCVFAGAASGNSASFATTSFEIGKALSQAGFSFIYGGGRTGLMGAFADGVIEAGGDIQGVIPQFLEDVEKAHQGVSKMVVTTTMHERKMLMYEPADGFLILPGGLGTLDETMEVLTWRQLGRLNGPVFIYSPNGYWAPMQELLAHITDEGFVHTKEVEDTFWLEDVKAIEKSAKDFFCS